MSDKITEITNDDGTITMTFESYFPTSNHPIPKHPFRGTHVTSLSDVKPINLHNKEKGINNTSLGKTE